MGDSLLRCRISSVLSGTLPLGMLLCACVADGEATPTPTLPPAATPTATALADVTPFPEGGILPGTDLQPEHVVFAVEEGRLTLSPAGGPWDAVSGTLTLSETVDGAEEPTCLRVFALSGPVLDDPGCAACIFVSDLTHYANESVGLCAHPDVPEAGEVRRLGLASDGRSLLWDYEGSGTWVPWYESTRVGDVVTFNWEDTFGYYPPEEED